MEEFCEENLNQPMLQIKFNLINYNLFNVKNYFTYTFYEWFSFIFPYLMYYVEEKILKAEKLEH